MAGTNQKLAFELDFNTKFNIDKAEIDKMAKTVEEAVAGIDPNIKIDAEELKKGITNVVAEFSKLENASKEVDKLLSGMDFNFDSKEAQAALKDIENMLQDIDNIDMSKLEAALNGLGDVDLDSMAKGMQDALNNINSDSARKEIAKLANEYDSMREEVMQSMQDQKELIAHQKAALAQMESMGMKGTASYKALKTEIKDNSVALFEMEKAAKQVGVANEESQGSFMDLAMKFQAFGAIGESLSGFAEKGMEAKVAMSNLSAQTGLTGENLENLRNISNDVFLAGVGDSIAESIKSIGAAQQQLGKFLDTQGIKDFTIAAGGISKVFGTDVNETIAKSRTFIANYGLDGKKAGELVSFAFQQTGHEDILDTLDEYSQLMVKAGYSAEEFVGVLSTGMKAGARDTDKLADSIKESQIRLNAGDTSKAVGEINSKVSAQINAIVQSAEAGQISIKEMTNQTSKILADAASKGDITSAIRDQYATAISGTMAEDMGGEMWTKIFSAKIDPSAVTAQAKAASEQIGAAMEPATFAQKVEKRLEILKTSFSETFGPVTAQLGGMMQTVAGVAPGLSVIGEQVGKFGGYVGSLGGISGAMSVLSSSTLGAAKSFITMGAAFAATPIGATIIAAVALLGAIKLISSALNKSAEEKLKEAKAEEEVLISQKKTLEVQRDKVKSNQELIKSYEDLGKKSNRTAEEESKLNDIKIKLAQAYPGVISGTKSFADNLSALKGAAQNSQGELANLNSQISETDKNIDKKRMLVVGAEIDVNKQAMEDKLANATGNFLNKATDYVFGSSKSRDNAEAFLKPYTDAIYNAGNAEDIKKAGSDLQIAIANNMSIKPETKTALIKDAQNMTEARIKAQEEQNKQLAKAMTAGVKDAYKDGVVTDEEVSQISKKFGKTEAEVRKLLDSVKEEANKAKLGEILSSSMEIKGNMKANDNIDALVKNYKNAKTDIERSQIGDVLAKAAPGAIKASQQFIDSNGILRTSYKLLDDKVKDSTKAAKDRYSNELKAKQGEIVTMIEKEGESYQATKAKMQALVDEKNKRKSTNPNADTSDLDKQYADLQGNLKASEKGIADMGLAAIKSGKGAGEVYALVAKETGKSPVEAKKLVDETIKASFSAETLAETWDKTSKQLSDNINLSKSAILEFNNKYSAIMKKKAEERTEDEEQFLNGAAKQRADLEKTARESIKQQKVMQKQSDDWDYKYGLKEVDRLAKAKESYDAKAAQIELDKLGYEFILKNQQLSENRKADSLDELLIEKSNLTMLENQKKALVDILKAKGLVKDVTTDGKIIFSSGVKPADKNEIGKMVMDLNSNIADSQIKVSDIKVKLQVEKKEVEKAANELKQEQIEWEITIGVRKAGDYGEVLAYYKKEGENIKSEVEKANKAIVDQKEKLTKDLAAIDEKAKAYNSTDYINGFANDLQKQFTKEKAIQKLYAEWNNEIFKYDGELTKKQLDSITKKYESKIKKEREGYKGYSVIFAEMAKGIQDLGFDISQQDVSVITAKYEKQIQDAKNTNDKIYFLKQEEANKIKELGAKASKSEIAAVRSKYATLIAEEERQGIDLSTVISSMNSDIEKLFTNVPESSKNALKLRFDQTLNLLTTNQINQQKAELENQKKQTEIVKKGLDERLAEMVYAYEKEKYLIDKKIAEEVAFYSKSMDAYTTARNANYTKSKENEVKTQDDIAAKQLSNLENQKQLELITEDDYNKKKEAIAEASQLRKEAIDEKYRRRQLKLDAFTNAAKIAAQDRTAAEAAEKQKASLDLQIKEMEKAKKEGDWGPERQKQLDELRKQYDEADKITKEKGDLIGRSLNSVQDGMQDAIAGMFAGSAESTADGVRKMFASVFAVLADALTTQAKVAVRKLLMDWLIDPSTGTIPIWAKLGLIPVMEAMIGGAVNAIVQPVITDVASFATGVRVDQPTLAIIGDAKQRGNPTNSETLFTDPQLMKMLRAASIGASAGLGEKLDRLNESFNNLSLVAKLENETLRVAVNRAEGARNSRAR